MLTLQYLGFWAFNFLDQCSVFLCLDLDLNSKQGFVINVLFVFIFVEKQILCTLSPFRENSISSPFMCI